MTVKTWLPAEPLLRQVDLAGGARATGISTDSAEQKALDRALASGRVSRRAADLLAVRVLRVHPASVWGRSWFCEADPP